ncbi:MAG: hypothetical protein Tsb0026_18500 [Sulfuricaulis sp.]
MTRKTFMMCLLAGLLAWTSAMPVEARRDDRRDDRSSRREEARHDGISLDEAVARVRRETGGRVLSAEARDSRYRIKVLMPNGAVRVVNVDARSGRMD